MKEPGPDHPITIAPHAGRIRVIANGITVADTTRALALKEASYPEVLYIPREDALWDHFARNARTTHCPYKGEANYFDLDVGGPPRQAAVCSYEKPFPAVARIKEYLAFYPDKVDAIEEG
ncbi:DUF427 domain-containing protein [Methylobacterium gnaphalii]|uniref:DUF427 domain-containing protein n=1 Tax=Methylobacterium gnaphalii TaxID=1010610 RepID=A0A512JLY1_9HYPH|nr:DUF427 domain-containing protein [Methylobacterium gnaphalii]GEP10977.1 hypothetical protein MGN01_28220 [Methylobacterium gnaphalii]GJD69755.1 hypothetical protein MMMDOFMJ_2693 [Methylobacterium gnaphalii]GLS50256.1 hypothetical protein GCM10007885_31080 [Methylobacterium gnaphalii]